MEMFIRWIIMGRRGWGGLRRRRLLRRRRGGGWYGNLGRIGNEQELGWGGDGMRSWEE
jgi:hypothetical protein